MYVLIENGKGTEKILFSDDLAGSRSGRVSYQSARFVAETHQMGMACQTSLISVKFSIIQFHAQYVYMYIYICIYASLSVPTILFSE